MKRIVIIGAGFAGLAAARALRHANADVLVIDRSNHNLFQPLLYQVATTVLSPAQIASPIRGLLKNQRNTTVILGEVSGINKDAKFVYASNDDHKEAALGYDILVIATGVTHSYFGHDEFAVCRSRPRVQSVPARRGQFRGYREENGVAKDSPKPCRRKTGSAAAMPYKTPLILDVDHLVPVFDAEIVERGNSGIPCSLADFGITPPTMCTAAEQQPFWAFI
jgi:hypothetical protein